MRLVIELKILQKNSLDTLKQDEDDIADGYPASSGQTFSKGADRLRHPHEKAIVTSQEREREPAGQV